MRSLLKIGLLPQDIKSDGGIPIHLAELLFKAVRGYPQKEAVRCHQGVFTYEQFSQRVYRLAHFLKDRGLGPGRQVAILHYNCHVFLESYFAAALIGAALVPLNYRLSSREIEYILNDSESDLIIVHSDFFPKIESVKNPKMTPSNILLVSHPNLTPSQGLDYEAVLASSSAEPLPDWGPGVETTAQIYYTSGTTGRPKGVMLSHKNCYLHALGTIAELQLTDSDVWLHVAPLFHLADAWATWAVTWAGGTHVLVREFEPRAVLDTMVREKVTLTNMIPTMLNLLINHPDFLTLAFPHLRVLLSGGAPIAPEVVRRIMQGFGCDYIQTYGMTETSPFLTFSLLKGHLKTLPPEKQFQFKARTGRAFIGVSLKVVRENGQEVRPDDQEVGEIIVQGDTITQGYWKLPEETQKAIKNGWLYTGDLAVIDAEGYVNIVDRKKDMIVTGGENVYSTEVENVLYQIPQILETAVFGIPDEQWGEAVHAAIVLKEGQQASKEEIIHFCKENLARYKAPKSISFLAQLPRTGSGKLFKKGLRDPFWERYDKKVQ
ncbi:MAG: long-chain-fatty-acid--CoA ligase [Candidatus Aquicultor sp.]